jgi:hypothetical protein
MQPHYPRSCSPDQIRTLQFIFDQICMELRDNGTFTGPPDPNTAHGKISRQVMRYEIGRQVMSYADDDQMTDGEITQAIVNRMSSSYRLEPSLNEPPTFRKPGAALHETSGFSFGKSSPT